MICRLSSILLLFFISISMVSAQKSLSDSVYVLYGQYFNMLKLAEQTSKELAQKLDSISRTVNADVQKVNQNYQYYNEVLEANNKKISSISETQLYTNKTLVERNIARTISSAEFVEAASTALNALDLTNQIFVYTDQITALNNPENTDLGFSLTRRVNTILEQEVFKGRTKINKVKKDRFLSLVDNILKSPITNSFMEGLPVVGSIKSVVDLVVNLSMQGEEISVVEVAELKNKLSDYVAYYQGLERALRQFESKVNSINVRTEALKLLLKNYVQDRVKTIYPKIQAAKLEEPLNRILMDNYNYPQVQKEIRRILAEDYTDAKNNVFYSLAVNDQRLRFPDFAVGQARFIADEIETIVSEYEAALTIYQKTLEEVLNKSRVIGNDDKINQKIADLKSSKDNVVQAIKRNVNLGRIKKSYQALVWDVN